MRDQMKDGDAQHQATHEANDDLHASVRESNNTRQPAAKYRRQDDCGRVGQEQPEASRIETGRTSEIFHLVSFCEEADCDESSSPASSLRKGKSELAILVSPPPFAQSRLKTIPPNLSGNGTGMSPVFIISRHALASGTLHLR